MLLLAQEIEKERVEKEKALRDDVPSVENRDERAASPMVSMTTSNSTSEAKVEGLGISDVHLGPTDATELKSEVPPAETREPELDVKMESEAT